jgi:hypothetical protein
MSNLKSKFAIALACALLVAFVTPIWATEYNVGVSEGQWIKYGNFVATGSGSADVNNTDWMKMEVVTVSGKNVTLHESGKFKNGTDTPESGSICNVETGWMNGTSGGFFLIIAANLQEGDTLPVPPPGTPLTINKTETGTYAGVSRSVNIYNLTVSMATYGSSTLVMIWDKASGMLLEMKMEMTSTITPSQNMRMSFSATDTNIFVTGPAGWLLENIIYIVIIVVAVIVVVAAVVLMRRRKPKPPPPTTTTKTTSET